MADISDIELRTPALRPPKPSPASSCQHLMSTQNVEETQLGAIDVAFCGGRQTAWVELLVHVKDLLDIPRLMAAVQRTLEFAHLITGCRVHTSIVQGNGFRVGVVERANDALLFGRPAASSLFEPPGKDLRGHHEVCTLRITTGTSSSVGTALGLTFDHALCDVGGAALLLARISAEYEGRAALMPRFDHGRGDQHALICAATDAKDDERSSAKAPVAGGIASVSWSYSSQYLHWLKDTTSAQTRHDAVWADIILLLRAAGLAVRSVSISRDGRARVGSGGVPPSHFGNATVHVRCNLPPAPVCAVALVQRIREAIIAPEADAVLRVPADVHFTTWWHPLQAQMQFGCDDEAATDFAIGPTTLAISARMCSKLSQPNVTVLPAAKGGLLVTLRAPLAIAQGVVQQLRAKAKSVAARQEVPAPSTVPSVPIVRSVDASPPPPPASAPFSSLPSLDLPRDTGPSPALDSSVVSVPAGHTAFSWLSTGCTNVQGLPLGHTSFSWYGSLVSESDCNAHFLAQGQSSSHILPQISTPGCATKPLPTRACIWLHGLGAPSSESWQRMLQGVADSCTGLLICFPRAPAGSVGAYPGRSLARWFDIATVPVGLNEPQCPTGLQDAVEGIHRLLDDLIEQGVPSERVVLGGFSQGGATALAAGLSYPSRLGGLCSISGWCIYRKALQGNTHRANVRVPIFFSAGTSDPVVDFRLARNSGEVLRGQLGDHVIVRHEHRAAHPPKQAEMEAAACFLRETLNQAPQDATQPALQVKLEESEAA